MCHDPCEHALHCIHVSVQYYVQTIPAEPIAHPFPVFPYLYVGTSKGKGAAQQFVYYFMMLVIISVRHLFIVAVWRYSCFGHLDTYACDLLWEYYAMTTRLVGQHLFINCLLESILFIFTVGVVSRSQRLVPALNSVRGTANSPFKLNQSILIQKS